MGASGGVEPSTLIPGTAIQDGQLGLSQALPANTGNPEPVQHGSGSQPGLPSAAAAAPARKRVKATDLDLESVKIKAGVQGVEALSIPELQCYLRAHKLPVGGKKVDLQQRLQTVLGPSQQTSSTAAPVSLDGQPA